MKYKNVLIYFLIAFLTCFNTSAQIAPLSDSAHISLLTNSPSNADVYRLFGHTAIRVNDKVNNIDIVFNYGVFDFDSPNFMSRFVKGETDYILAAYSFERYLFEYQLKEIAVYEQVLNLTPEEKLNIYNALLTNLQPANRKYRYNFFFDNCSTRPRDIIERNINGKINYTPTNKGQTFRNLVHECVNVEPWVRFGIDLVIGNGADSIISDRQKAFLPIYLEKSYKGATITNNETTKNLISEEGYILTFDDSPIYTGIDYPLIAGCVLFVVVLLYSLLTFRKKQLVSDKILDFLLFLVYGCTGCIITFLMFASEHPCTNPNWNIIWLNPLQLIFAFLFIPKILSKCVCYYHFINFALLILFLVGWVMIPQQLETAFIPYILTLCLRSGTNIVKYKKSEKARK